MDQEKENRQVAGPRKNHVVFKWILIIVALTIIQISLFVVDNDQLYWLLHDTITDFIELTFAITLFKLISYAVIQFKMISACLVAWFFYAAFSQIITDYKILNTDDAMIGSIFTTVFIIVTFLARFIIRWRPDKIEIEPAHFYEVIGKPTNLSQLIVAMYTGHGGAFGITDGVHLWHYSKQHDSMICEKLDPTYLMGRMIHKICSISAFKYFQLNGMTGQRFTLMHNCLELHSLSGKWK